MTGLFLVGMLLFAAAAFGQWPFGTKEYAGDISVQAFLVPLQAAADALAAPEGFSAESLATMELPPGSRVCLLLALQNNGNRRAWGVAEMRWNGREIAVDVPGLPPHMEHPFFNVVEVSDCALPGAVIPELRGSPLAQVVREMNATGNGMQWNQRKEAWHETEK